MELASQQGRALAMAETGAVFVIIKDESVREIKKVVQVAAAKVPEGRLLFAIWRLGDDWSESIPVESTFLTTLLGPPKARTDNTWDFYGTGAVRLYTKGRNRPTSSLMWSAARRVGPKAYSRIRLGSVTPEVMTQSTIPVSHKVFTRDVANNVWHLAARNGTTRVIERLQFLTTWSDEVALVHQSDRFTTRKHKGVTFADDLVPVANKIPYELDGFPFPTSVKSGKFANEQIPLF